VEASGKTLEGLALSRESLPTFLGIDTLRGDIRGTLRGAVDAKPASGDSTTVAVVPKMVKP